MKVSEAIDRLAVGDTVWVKGEVNYTNKAELFSICCDLATTSFWICDDDEISLTEPQAEKVEVELTRSQADFMKEHENDSLYKLMRASIPEYEELFARARLNGYTVKPKRWVVTTTDSDTCYLKRFRMGKECLDGDISKVWVGELGWAFTFDDRAKADAVALLVDGSVEEV